MTLEGGGFRDNPNKKGRNGFTGFLFGHKMREGRGQHVRAARGLREGGGERSPAKLSGLLEISAGSEERDGCAHGGISSEPGFNYLYFCCCCCIVLLLIGICFIQLIFFLKNLSFLLMYFLCPFKIDV